MGVLDQLIQPVWVTIESLAATDREWDENSRDALHGSLAPTVVTIQAQIVWGDRNDPRATVGGAREESRGYIVISISEESQSGTTLKRGDRITAMGTLTGLDLYLTESEPFGHWSSGGPRFKAWRFTDRQPTHSAP